MVLVKVPLLWVMKVHILFLGVPNNRLTCMQGQKNTFIVLKYAFIFSFFAHDSQTVRSKIHFSKPLLCVTLICGDWSDEPVCCDWSSACSACQ